MKLKALLAGVALAAVAAGGASATTISWADLTADNGSSTVTGSITTGSGTVDVTIDAGSAGYDFAQINNTGTNFWTGAGYTYNGSFNQPTTSDIVGLGAANTTTITFSKPVTNLYLALNSWNGASATLDHTFTVAAEGCGYWGCGSFVPNSTNTAFTGSGEAVGILEIPGTITSLTLNDTVTEYWHGLTVGIGGVATNSGIPEPATWALMLAGFGGAGLMLRGRRKAVTAGA